MPAALCSRRGQQLADADNLGRVYISSEKVWVLSLI